MSKILDILGEIPTSAVLRERLAFVKEQVQAMEKTIETLQEENSNLKKQVSQLQTELSSKAKADEFVEQDGALFKRNGTKGYHRAVFCIKCKGPMTSLPHTPFICTASGCGTSVGFTSADLDRIIKSLPKTV